MACSNPKHTIHGNRTIQPSVPLKCFPTGGCSLCQGWTTETPGWCFGIVFPCPIVDLVCILCRGCCCKKSDSLGITACTFVPFCTTCLPILVRSTRSFQDQLALPHNLPAGSTCGSGSTRDAQAFFSAVRICWLQRTEIIGSNSEDGQMSFLDQLPDNHK